MSIRKISLVLFCYWSMLSLISAQSTETSSHNISTWTNIKVQKKLTKKLDLFISPEVRTVDQSVDRYLGDMGIKYKILKWLDAGITYRFAQEAKNSGGFKKSHRFAFDLKTGRSYGNFDPEFRLRFTNKYDVRDAEYIRNVRFKGSIDYDIPKSKITPFINSELFYKSSEDVWSKYRIGTGASWKLNKTNAIQLAYVLQREFEFESNEHIFRLGYKFKF